MVFLYLGVIFALPKDCYYDGYKCSELHIFMRSIEFYQAKLLVRV
jgi:hypothetical protein